MSVRKAQTDFFSPMTGNVFRDNRRRADLIMEAAKVEMIKTDDPFTQIAERKSYAPQEDPASISDAFDKEYGVLSDEEAAVILEENKKKIEEPTPVIDPDPELVHQTPKPDPKPEVKPENTPEKAVEKATEYKKKGREAYMGNSISKVKKAAMISRRLSGRRGTSGTSGGGGSSASSSSKGSSTRGGRSQGRGGARGGSTGGRGASSKGGVSRGSRRGGVGRGGRRGGRRCDIRCKFDISLLSNMNLVRDDLAELAYFVKEVSN